MLKKKSQASLEYLTTYAWAFILLIVALAAIQYFGILDFKKYLPQQLTEPELTAIIKKTIETLGAKTKADIGRVMKEVMPQVSGKADGKQVNQIALTFLN